MRRLSTRKGGIGSDQSAQIQGQGNPETRSEVKTLQKRIKTLKVNSVKLKVEK
jgi:hypothetical protein